MKNVHLCAHSCKCLMHLVLCNGKEAWDEESRKGLLALGGYTNCSDCEEDHHTLSTGYPFCLWHRIVVKVTAGNVSCANERGCHSSSIVYLFGSQSFQVGWDHLWWPVKCALLFAILLQFSLSLPFQGMSLFFVPFRAFQSHTVSLQWVIKICRGEKSPTLINITYYYLSLHRPP